MKKHLTLLILLLALGVGSAIGPGVASLPVAAQEGGLDGPDIASYVAAELVPAYVLDAGAGEVTSLAISPDNQLIAAAYAGGLVQIWQVAEGSVVQSLDGHRADVRTVAFSPDGARLATGSDDSTVLIWDVEAGAVLQTMKTTLSGRVLDLAYSPDGVRLAVSGHLCNIEIRLASNGLRTRTLALSQCGIRRGGSADNLSIAFTPDGSGLYVGVGEGAGESGVIVFWNVDSYTTPKTLAVYDLGVQDLVVAPGGEQIGVALAGSADVRLLDEAGLLADEFEGHVFRVNGLAFSPDGRLLASASRDGTVKLWGTSLGSELRSLEGHTGAVNEVAFSPNGSFLATGGADGTVVIWLLSVQ